VRYSQDQSCAHTAAASSFASDSKYWHSAAITGLTADTTYHYRIYTNGSDLTPWTDVTFRTAPPLSATQVTFAALGDSRPGSASAALNQAARDVATQLALQDFAFAVHAGDIIYAGGICTGDDSSWNQYLRAYFDVFKNSINEISFYTAIGNHELNNGSCGYQAYTDVGGVVYFDTGGAGANTYAAGNEWFAAYASSRHHFMMLSVDSCTMNIEVIDNNGDVFDSYQIDKCPANFAPQAGIDVVNNDDAQLAWQHITPDSDGEPVNVVKYYVYRDATPYLGASATRMGTMNGPFSSNLITWPDPNHVGDSAVNYFYYVRSVTPFDEEEILSDPSNHMGEFDFPLNR